MHPFSLAWSTLTHKRGRTALAAGGVAFAVLLVFMELGLLGGVGRTATILFDKLNFDIVLTSSEYLDLGHPGDFQRDRLAQCRAVAGVEEAVPLYVGVGTWRLPGTSGWFGRVPGGGEMSINVIATPPDHFDSTFRIGPDGAFATVEEAQAAARKLGRLDAFLFDRASKPEFGDIDRLVTLGEAGSPAGSAAADRIRLNGRRAVVVGAFDLGTGFSWNGMLLTSEETYARYMMRPANRVNLGLVRLAPGREADEATRRLRAILPSDVKVHTRTELEAAERRFWLRLTSIGQFLGVSVVLAVVVGIIFVYQMMAADIRNRLGEYATVKALGYRAPYLTRTVLWQAVLLAMLGYGPGLVAAVLLYGAARAWGGIPANLTYETAAGVFVLTCGMCLASGFLAVRKVHAADPADLF